MNSHLNKLIQCEFISQENQQESLLKFIRAIEEGLVFKNRDSVVNHKSMKELQDILLEPLPDKGVGFDETLNFFVENIAKHSTNFGSKNFMAFPDCGNSISAITGSILSDFLNQNLINSQYCAPTATVIESNTISWLRELIGYDVNNIATNSVFDTGGIITVGGVLSNTTAMLIAREKAFPGTKNTGITFNPSKVKVIIPEFIDHYSIRASLGWIGLGDENVLRVKTIDFKIDQNHLEELMSKHKVDYHVMAIVSYAGDSRTMTIDDFEGIHKISKKYDVWMHVDACHGFQFSFNENLKHKIKGIELADSVTTDPHKVLFLPYNLSAVLLKDPANIKLISGTSDLIMQEDHAFGQVTPFVGSKAFWSLKLWFMMKSIGTTQIGELIEKRHLMAKKFAYLLKQNSNFVVLNKDVNINSVTFMYIPSKYKNVKTFSNEDIEHINATNKMIHHKLFSEGSFYLHTFPIPDLTSEFGDNTRMLQPMRFMSGNPHLTEEDLNAVINHIIDISQ